MIIIFGLISPFLIYLGFLSIFIDIHVYYYMISQKGWLIYPFLSHFSFPIWYIKISIIISNLYLMLLSYFLVGKYQCLLLTINLVGVIITPLCIKCLDKKNPEESFDQNLRSRLYK